LQQTFGDLQPIAVDKSMHDKRIPYTAEPERIRVGELVGVCILTRSIASVFLTVQIGLICTIGISERRDRFNDYQWFTTHRFSKPHNRNGISTNSIATNWFQSSALDPTELQALRLCLGLGCATKASLIIFYHSFS